jgi:hypothetical protein
MNPDLPKYSTYPPGQSYQAPVHDAGREELST